MLPFRHSNKNNEMSQAATGSLVRKADRQALKTTQPPCNASAGYLNSSAPSVFVCPPPPPQTSQFRQRTRPAYLQMNEPHRLRVPGHSTLARPAYSCYNSGYGGSIRPLSPLPPPSPGLNQVLTTELKPGPNVVWFCERKREKSKLWTYRKHLVCLLLLLTVGLILYKAMSFTGGNVKQGVRESHHRRLEIERATLEESTENTQILEEEYIEEVEEPEIVDSVISAGNFTHEIKSETVPAAAIKILFSVNEDLESTVEVIEG